MPKVKYFAVLLEQKDSTYAFLARNFRLHINPRNQFLRKHQLLKYCVP
jgi:hypothetical protein